MYFIIKAITEGLTNVPGAKYPVSAAAVCFNLSPMKGKWKLKSRLNVINNTVELLEDVSRRDVSRRTHALSLLFTQRTFRCKKSIAKLEVHTCYQ